MRKAPFSILALGAILVCLPASAQTISSLTLGSNNILGGQTTNATITLSTPAPTGGATVSVFTLAPTEIFVPDTVSVAQGATTASFRVNTLPLDATVYSFVGASVNNSTQFAGLTIQQNRAFRTRVATFRPGTQQWFLRSDLLAASSPIQFGQAGDQPLPADYLEGNGRAQIAVFRPGATAVWMIRANDGTTNNISFGTTGDIPAPADYLQTGKTQMAVFRPSNQTWMIRPDAGGTPMTISVPFAQAGDQPVSADYLGGKHGQFAVYRSTTQQWLIRNDDGTTQTIALGQAGDIPVPGDYLGTGRAQVAIYRPSTAQWLIRPDAGGTPTTIQWGLSGIDQPVPGDYLQLGHAQLATFRPSTGQWFIRTDQGDPIILQFGGVNDQPVPAAYAPRFGQ